ncbi:MAG: orotidine-5'-phosphate decarboxylase [Fimbriimonadaceae bacterium]|jgi:orotidine-5'-phosphate decarboxylase|nr:orotidine-5'-phosphate decarboxylase [Fimbriimonadaceae bacterium]
MKRKIICALDTSNLDEALATVQKLKGIVGAFKIGHALTLPSGLDVISRLREAGAERVFLDLKFHDIPNSVALAVREAAKRGVWMVTVHLSGGPAMLAAAAEEAKSYSVERAPMVVGVSVLTSLTEKDLHDHLAVNRSLVDQMVSLSRLGIENGLDGVVCSAHEISAIRPEIGHSVIVVPGIRPVEGDADDQRRVGTAQEALKDGADYLVIGRALTSAADPLQALARLGFTSDVA